VGIAEALMYSKYIKIKTVANCRGDCPGKLVSEAQGFTQVIEREHG
jgi:hypothetical protein